MQEEEKQDFSDGQQRPNSIAEAKVPLDCAPRSKSSYPHVHLTGNSPAGHSSRTDAAPTARRSDVAFAQLFPDEGADSPKVKISRLNPVDPGREGKEIQGRPELKESNAPLQRPRGGPVRARVEGAGGLGKKVTDSRSLVNPEGGKRAWDSCLVSTAWALYQASRMVKAPGVAAIGFCWEETSEEHLWYTYACTWNADTDGVEDGGFRRKILFVFRWDLVLVWLNEGDSRHLALPPLRYREVWQRALRLGRLTCCGSMSGQSNHFAGNAPIRLRKSRCSNGIILAEPIGQDVIRNSDYCFSPGKRCIAAL